MSEEPEATALSIEEQKDKLSKELLFCCNSGNVVALSKLLDSNDTNLDINHKDEDGNTAIITSACFGHSKIISLLIIAGANIESVDEKGWTPLFWALTNGLNSLD
jgi:ankyrin repeat protein